MDWLDTLLNVSTFVAVGLLVWLYVREEDDAPPRDTDDRRDG